MSANMTLGSLLREARERKGMDIPTAARKLKIRSDVVQALEEDDYGRLPARGYVRNMVNAYAHLLGVDQAEASRLFESGVYAHQVGMARGTQRSSYSNRAYSSSRSSAREDDYRPRARGSYEDSGSYRSTRSRSRNEHQDDFRDEYVRSPRDRADERYGSDRTRRANAQRQGLFGRTLYDDRSEASSRTYSQDRTHPSRHAALPNTQYMNFYAGEQPSSVIRQKLPLIIGIAAVLVIVLIVFFFLFGNNKPAQDVPDVPITGLTDTSNPVDNSSTTQTAPAVPTVTVPDKVVFAYSVSSGSTAYIEVYEGGSDSPSVAGDVAGATEKSFDVTSTLKFVTTNPENVTLTLDGAEVQADDNGDGVYVYKVDFDAYLTQWKADHASELAAAEAAAASTEASASTN